MALPAIHVIGLFAHCILSQLCVPESSESQHITSRGIYTPLSQEIWPQYGVFRQVLAVFFFLN